MSSAKIYASKNLLNVRHRTTNADDIHRQIVSVPQYLQSLPPTLLELTKHAFRLENGTCPSYRQDSDFSDVKRKCGEALYANQQKRAENRGNFFTPMFNKSVLKGGTC